MAARAESDACPIGARNQYDGCGDLTLAAQSHFAADAKIAKSSSGVMFKKDFNSLPNGRTTNQNHPGRTQPLGND
jgi:hypothetical protein